MTARRAFSALLAGVAGLLVVATALCWSVDRRVVDQQAFADQAVAALHRDAVRRAVSAELFAEIDPEVPDSAASSGEVRTIVDRTVARAPFERVYREGALTLNRALFHADGSNATLRVNLARVLRPTSPQLATVVGDRDATIFSLRAGGALDATNRGADLARTLALTLPFFAAAALIGALLLAPRRARVAVVAGAAAAAAGAVLLVALILARAQVDQAIDISGVGATQARDAAHGIWDVFAAQPRTIAIGALAGGLLVAVAGLVAGRRPLSS